MNPIISMLDTVRKNVGEEVATIFDYGFDLAPYLGSIIQTRKINRIQTRLKTHSQQLRRINQLFTSEEVSVDFIQERIGPIILSDLIEEHEDSKIVYILNGFENIFINENINESLIINYYDTLRILRYADVRKLYFYSAITEDNFESSEEELELQGLSQQIYSKLERLHLIKPAKSWGVLETGAELLSEEERKVELTIYGKNFIKFIAKDFDEEKYNERISKYDLSEEDKISRNVIAKWG